MTWKARKSAAAVARRTRNGKSKRAQEARLSRLKKPEDMSLDDWQRELRKQFGREQAYRLANLGEQPLFSEFEVTTRRAATPIAFAFAAPAPAITSARAPIL